jgi:H+-transporting ATPase
MSDEHEKSLLLQEDVQGLSAVDAAERLSKYGSNTVVEKPPRALSVLLHKFWGVVPWMLELAVIIDLILGRWIEGLFISALLILNAILGFRQETHASKALMLLRQRLTVTARVRRDGNWELHPAADLVPGDLVRLRVGDVVPADIALTSGQIQVDQSQLTGESLPVDHQANSTTYAGSLVSRGEATGLITATGSHTYFGKTAELVRLAQAPPRLEHLVVGIAKYLAALDILLALSVFAVSLSRGTPLSFMLPFSLMLLVASVPMALPVMFTMAAGMGARMLADKGVLVTRLSAIEDAASMDVLCIDKTGTLTQNRLAVKNIAPIAPTTSIDVLRLAALASDEATQDPIDLAILQAANEQQISIQSTLRFDLVPFEPSTKRTEVSIHEDGQVVRIMKGAPTAIAELAHTPWVTISSDVERLSADGSRVLAVATGIGLSLHIVGLITLSDPPREDSASLIQNLRQRGVRVLLVTGDGEATAQAVATTVGITGGLAPAGTLHENMNAESISHFEVFAGVFPEDKFFLVQALQKSGHVVGMTGDGVNDAPALRQADIGIAVSSATDVAKAAGGLILTKPGLGEIVMAIEGSRRSYRRMQTFVLTMMTRKISIPLFLSLGVILLGVFVLNPLLIVLLMIITDIATMAVSTDQVTASSNPDHWAVRPLMVSALGLAVPLIFASGIIVWVSKVMLKLDLAQTQTIVFLWLVMAGSQGILYLTRTRDFFWTKPHPARLLNVVTLVLVSSVTALALGGWLMAPISLLRAGALLLLALLFLVSVDLLKVALSAKR